MCIALDLASFNVVNEKLAEFDRLVTEYVDIVFGNNQEAFSLTGEKPEMAAVTIGKLAKIAVVKLGAEGSLIHANGKTIRVGVRPSKPVDTTGAGDTFLGLFLARYDQTGDLKTSLHFAVTGAAIQVTRPGTADAIPSLEEIENAL